MRDSQVYESLYNNDDDSIMSEDELNDYPSAHIRISADKLSGKSVSIDDYDSYMKSRFLIDRHNQHALNKRFLNIIKLFIFYSLFLVSVLVITYILLFLVGIGYDIYSDKDHCHLTKTILADCPTKGLQEITNNITISIICAILLFTLTFGACLSLSCIGFKRFIFSVQILSIILSDCTINTLCCSCDYRDTKQKISYRRDRYNLVYEEL